MLNPDMRDGRAVETIMRSLGVFGDTRAKETARLRAEPR